MSSRKSRWLPFGQKNPIRKNKESKKVRLSLEPLEERLNPGPFTPGNLVVLQAGDGVNQYVNQAPLFLNEVNPSTGANVQQKAIPNNETVGGIGNQPITLDLTAAAGN